MLKTLQEYIIKLQEQQPLLLQQADGLDSRASGFLGAVSGAAVLEQTWSDPGNEFGRSLLVPACPGARVSEASCA